MLHGEDTSCTTRESTTAVAQVQLRCKHIGSCLAPFKPTSSRAGHYCLCATCSRVSPSPSLFTPATCRQGSGSGLPAASITYSSAGCCTLCWVCGWGRASSNCLLPAASHGAMGPQGRQLLFFKWPQCARHMVALLS